jgi:hypothetical protein
MFERRRGRRQMFERGGGRGKCLREQEEEAQMFERGGGEGKYLRQEEPEANV